MAHDVNINNVIAENEIVRMSSLRREVVRRNITNKDPELVYGLFRLRFFFC